MPFELPQALMEDILFAMENQETYFLLDTRTGTVAGPDDDDYPRDNGTEDSGEGADNYIALPEWSPQDGFRLMEHFTSGLRNPLVREELSSALNRGKGVFRAFKDVLVQYPETEKLWFKYKDREMKNRVIAWYNAYREKWGLELIGPEPEDTTGLIHEDFLIREGTNADLDKAVGLHKLCLEAGNSDGRPNAAVFQSMNQWVFPGDLCLIAETRGGDFSGYICAKNIDPSSIHIYALEVDPAYRGLGLGKAILNRFIEKAACQIRNITIDLESSTDNFSRALLQEEFTPCVQRYLRVKPEGQ